MPSESGKHRLACQGNSKCDSSAAAPHWHGHRKPKVVSRKLDPAKQAAFIEAYDTLMNRLSADEAVIFVDAVHPTHAVLGAERGAGRGGTEQRAGPSEHPWRD